MAMPPDFQRVVARAGAILGKDATRWLYKPNRSLAQLSPYEMAQSAAGARVVLGELERTIVAEDGFQSGH
jgi:uncharacterized protein (DUF2384 family)